MLENPAVGWNPVTACKEHHVAGHQNVVRYLALSAIAQNARDRYGSSPKPGERACRFPFGSKANQRIEQDDDQDGDGFGKFAKSERYPRRSQEQPDDEALELVEDDCYERPLFGFGKAIGTVTAQPLHRILIGQAAGDLRA